MTRPNYQTNLLDLIIEQQQDQQLRQLQYELPAAPRGHPRDGWELIFEHLGGKKRYYCVNCDHNIITAKHISKHQAIEEAYDYALLFELLPVAILQIRHRSAELTSKPGPLAPRPLPPDAHRTRKEDPCPNAGNRGRQSRTNN